MYTRRRPKTPLNRLASLSEVVAQETPPNTPTELMAQLYAGLERKGLLARGGPVDGPVDGPLDGPVDGPLARNDLKPSLGVDRGDGDHVSIPQPETQREDHDVTSDGFPEEDVDHREVGMKRKAPHELSSPSIGRGECFFPGNFEIDQLPWLTADDDDDGGERSDRDQGVVDWMRACERVKGLPIATMDSGRREKASYSRLGEWHENHHFDDETILSMSCGQGLLPTRGGARPALARGDDSLSSRSGNEEEEGVAGECSGAVMEPRDVFARSSPKDDTFSWGTVVTSRRKCSDESEPASWNELAEEYREKESDVFLENVHKMTPSGHGRQSQTSDESGLISWSELVDEYQADETEVFANSGKIARPSLEGEAETAAATAAKERLKSDDSLWSDLSQDYFDSHPTMQREREELERLRLKSDRSGSSWAAGSEQAFFDTESDVVGGALGELRGGSDEDGSEHASWGEQVEEFLGEERMAVREHHHDGLKMEASEDGNRRHERIKALAINYVRGKPDINIHDVFSGRAHDKYSLSSGHPKPPRPSLELSEPLQQTCSDTDTEPYGGLHGMAPIPALMSQSWFPEIESNIGDEEENDDDSCVSTEPIEDRSSMNAGVTAKRNSLVVGSCTCVCCRRWVHGQLEAGLMECAECQVDDRKLKPKPPSPPDPHESLLRDIRAQPKLKPVRKGKLVVETSRTRLNEEDDLEPALPVKRVIKPDLNLLINSSFEESSDDDDMSLMVTPPSSPPLPTEAPPPSTTSTSTAVTEAQTSQVTWRRTAARDVLTSDVGAAQRPSKLQRRHTIMVCESPLDGKVLPGDLPPLAEEEDEPSPIKESHSLASLHSGLRPHPLGIPKTSFSDHDLQSQVVTLRHPPGGQSARRLSLEHRRSLTSLPIGLSAIPELDDSSSGVAGGASSLSSSSTAEGGSGSSGGSRPANLFRRSWSTEQAPPPNPSPPCKARVRTSASMSMKGSKPRASAALGLPHASSNVNSNSNSQSQHLVKQPLATTLSDPSSAAAASTATQPIGVGVSSRTSAACMPGSRPPSFFSSASINVNNSADPGFSPRHAQSSLSSRGPALTRRSSLPSSSSSFSSNNKHVSVNSCSSVASSVTSPPSSSSQSSLPTSSSSPSSLPSSTQPASSSPSSSKAQPSDMTSSISQGHQKLNSSSLSSSISSSSSSSSSSSTWQREAQQQAPTSRDATATQATSGQSQLDASSSSQSPFFSRNKTRLASASGPSAGQPGAAIKQHTVIEMSTATTQQRLPQSQSRWRNPNAREERLMRRQAKPGTSPRRDDSEDVPSPSSTSTTPSPSFPSVEPSPGEIDVSRPRRFSLDSGVNLYTDANPATAHAACTTSPAASLPLSPGDALSPVAAVGRRLSVGTGGSPAASRKKLARSTEEEEKLSRWRALQEDELEEKMRAKAGSASNTNTNGVHRFQSLSVSIPDQISEEDDYSPHHHSQQHPPPPPHQQSSPFSSNNQDHHNHHHQQQQQMRESPNAATSLSSSPHMGARPFNQSANRSSRLSRSGQRLLCESPDAIKQHMMTEEARLSRWRNLEETGATTTLNTGVVGSGSTELEFVSGESSPLDLHATSGCTNTDLDPSSSFSFSPSPHHHHHPSPSQLTNMDANQQQRVLAQTLSQGKSSALPKRWENPIECLSLTLEEVTHIRSVLTKAELESLISHPDLYQQVSKSKLCFTCKTVKFSLFGEWGTKCKFCKRTVCSKCLRKMNVPTDHFRNIPVYTLSPTPLSAEMQEFIQTYIRRAPPSSVPATRATSPSRSSQPQLPSPDSLQTSTTLKPTGLEDTEPPTSPSEPSESTLHSSTQPGANRPFFNKSSSGKPLQRSQSALTSGQKPGQAGGVGGLRSAMKGPLMAICCDCKGMVMEIIRASRTSLALIMTPGASEVSAPLPPPAQPQQPPAVGPVNKRLLGVSQSFRY